MNIPMKVKILRDGVSIPKYATEGSAALDLCAAISEPLTIPAGEKALIPCGIAISIPFGYVAIISARSGLSSKKGLTAVNGIGVIDSDYRGEIFYSCINHSKIPQTIKVYERVAQMMLLPVLKADIEIVETLDQTERGDGGFGSTGTK